MSSPSWEVQVPSGRSVSLVATLLCPFFRLLDQQVLCSLLPRSEQVSGPLLQVLGDRDRMVVSKIGKDLSLRPWNLVNSD